MNNRDDIEAPADVTDFAAEELDSSGQQPVPTQEWVDTDAATPEPSETQRSKKSSDPTPDIEQP
jgi:hypothetical protein